MAVDIGAWRSAADAAIDAGHTAVALGALHTLWRHHPGPSTAAFVNSRLGRIDSPRQAATIAFARSFTLEPIVPLLRAAAGLNGLDLSVHIGDFNTYSQELLSPSSDLYNSWHPDVTFLAVQTRDIAPELWESDAELSTQDLADIAERVCVEVERLVASYRSLSSTPLVLHGLELPERVTLGLADAARPLGQRAAVVAINQRLANLAREVSGVHVLDYDALVSSAGRRHWYDPEKWHSMRMPIRSYCMADLAAEWLRYIQPLVGRSAKALVVDLDNTLWGGVVGEDGPGGLQLSDQGAGAGYRALQRDIRALRQRGILLAICSKNNELDAFEVLDRHEGMILRRHDFATTRINWQSKVDNLRSIAAELNIGLDSMALLDDNPSECAHVRHELPEVTVIELDVAPTTTDNPIVRNPFFERLTLSDEDRLRTVFYVEQKARATAQSKASSVEDYLMSLQLRVGTRPMVPAEVERVAQLTQKTNQMNLTTRRYTDADIEAMMHSDVSRVYVTRAEDRFGDHGLVGVMIAHTTENEWQLDSLLLSCRVIGRGVEAAMLAYLVADAQASGCTNLSAQFIETAKNAPAAQLLSEHGFCELSNDGGVHDYAYDLHRGTVSLPPWIEERIVETS